MDVSADFSDLERLAVNLGRVPARVVDEVYPVVSKALLNIKTDTRSTISDHPTWSRLEPTVTYEQVGLSGEVGYEDRGQGELAGIYEFGSARRAPHPTLYPAAGREAPRFEAAAARAAGKAVEESL